MLLNDAKKYQIYWYSIISYELERGEKEIHNRFCLSYPLSLEERNNPLKPQRGEKYIGPETGTIYEWDG
jgi:hypothetical protein